jgi:hypothetical protein
MNFSNYPIKDSLFYSTEKKQIKKSEDSNCFMTQGFVENNQANVYDGYHKPLNEICPPINSKLKNINEIGGLPWNNMTKRKSLVDI